MTNIIPFSFENHEVRVITDNGEPLFVGKDVCLALGYARPNDAMTQHCKGAVKRRPLQTQGGIQEIRVLAEPDVLRLIMKSKLPAAQAFEAMVFEEILPTIRKTGWWGEPVTSIPPRLTARQVREAVGMLRSFTYVNRITGMEKNQALLAANRRVQENTGINLLQQTGATHLLANDTDHLLTPTAIGQQCQGASARAINQKLKEMGLQIQKSTGKEDVWIPTPRGEAFAVMLDTGKKHSNGTPIRQLKWRAGVLSLFKTQAA